MALAYTEEIEIFNIETVKYLVTYQWRELAPIIKKMLFYPFLIYLVMIHIYVFLARKSILEEFYNDDENTPEKNTT